MNTTMTLNRSHSTSERGMSLIELLVALAITAILAAAFMQSLQSTFAFTSRASSAASAAIDDGVIRRQFSSVINGLVEAWPDQEAYVFVGADDRLVGLSRNSLSATRPSITPIAIRTAKHRGRTELIYDEAGTSLTLASFPEREPSRRSGFHYLSDDGRWHRQWPPQSYGAMMVFGERVDVPPPQLPVAIRLVAGDQVWLARIENNVNLPFRLQEVGVE